MFVISRLNKYKLLNILIYRSSENLELDKNSEFNSLHPSRFRNIFSFIKIIENSNRLSVLLLVSAI